VAVEVGQLGVALDLLDGQVAVGHGMADGGHPAALGFEDVGTLRLVWLLPQPVRTAQTETTGLVLLTMVSLGPSRTNVAPAAWTWLALCMTYSWATSL